MNNSNKTTRELAIEWYIDYANDTGQNDEGFWEWWNVTNDVLSFKCNKEDDANTLLNIILENKLLRDSNERMKEALKDIENKSSFLRDGIKSNSPADAQISEIWTIARAALQVNPNK